MISNICLVSMTDNNITGIHDNCVRDVVHRMNEEYRALGALRSVLNNGGLWIYAKKCLYEGVI